MFERESFRPSNCMRNYFLRDLYQTFYYEDNFVHNKIQCHSSSLCWELFSWWNSLFLFFNLKHQIDWYIKHTKYFLRVPCGIHSGLLCYHKKQKQQPLKTAFVTIATKFMSVFWVCHNKWKLWRYSVLVILLKAITFQEFLC